MKVSNDKGKRVSSMPAFLTGVAMGVAMTMVGLSLLHYFNPPAGRIKDRNGDGKVDVIYSYRSMSSLKPKYPTIAKYDNNFDGVYDTFYTFDRYGLPVQGKIDRDQDDKPDIVEYYRDGVLEREEFLDKKTGKILKRIYYSLGKRSSEEVDLDGDGVFEQKTYFNAYEFPESAGEHAGEERR